MPRKGKRSRAAKLRWRKVANRATQLSEQTVKHEEDVKDHSILINSVWFTSGILDTMDECGSSHLPDAGMVTVPPKGRKRSTVEQQEGHETSIKTRKRQQVDAAANGVEEPSEPLKSPPHSPWEEVVTQDVGAAWSAEPLKFTLIDHASQLFQASAAGLSQCATAVRASDSQVHKRIVVYGDDMVQAVVPNSAKPFNFQEAYGLSDEQALKVSDHYPVEVKLKYMNDTAHEEDDDDMEQQQVQPPTPRLVAVDEDLLELKRGNLLLEREKLSLEIQILRMKMANMKHSGNEV